MVMRLRSYHQPVLTSLSFALRRSCLFFLKPSKSLLLVLNYNLSDMMVLAELVLSRVVLILVCRR